LPLFPKRFARRVNFCVERATGTLFRKLDVRLVVDSQLAGERQRGVDVRTVNVTGGVPPLSIEANLGRLARLALRGSDEQLAGVDGRTAYFGQDRWLAIDVVDKHVPSLPPGTSNALRQLVERLARDPRKGAVTIPYRGQTEGPPPALQVPSSVGADDVILGGDAHKDALLRLLAGAKQRVIIHSTFVSAQRFEDLLPEIAAACRRGVRLDLLWGADEDEAQGNSLAASEIMSMVREDVDLEGRVRVHMRSTGSHAKLFLSDTPGGDWVAVVGSCNWLLSPFRSLEMSAILGEPPAVALVVRALARLAGRRGAPFDDLSTELALLARHLDESPAPATTPTGSITLVEGPAHEEVARHASGQARRRLIFGSHRLGSTARPGALLQSVAAATRAAVDAVVIYTRPSGSLKAADARALEEEMRGLGVRLIAAEDARLHGKFLAWDDDDFVVTSFNWASATVDSAFREAELGVHLRAPGLAADVLRRLDKKLPSAALLGAVNVP
jgi:phosphatidylserine/phosphatidylglycerophosphate/cardiolipin synthase-like enzyme